MNDEYELIDLRTDVSLSAKRQELCEAFYKDVYLKAFSKPGQSESPGTWLPLMNSDLPPPSPILHLIVARRKSGQDADQVIGGIVIEYFRGSRTALVTYLVVAPEARRRGLARRLLDAAVQKVTADNGDKRPLILGEVERPEAQASGADRAQAVARLGIIGSLGGLLVVIDYVQPSLGEGKPPLDDLSLVTFPARGAATKSLRATQLKTFIAEFYESLEQGGSPEQQRVLRSLSKMRISVRALVAQ